MVEYATQPHTSRNIKKVLFIISEHEFGNSVEATQIKNLHNALGIHNSHAKHIHWTSKKRISDHWKLLLRICRNDPTSDFLVYTYCGYKIAKHIKVVDKQANLYDTDEKLMHLANNCPGNIRIISLMDKCNCLKADSIG